MWQTWSSPTSHSQVRTSRWDMQRTRVAWSWIDAVLDQAWFCTSSRRCPGWSCVETTVFWTAIWGLRLSTRNPWPSMRLTQMKRDEHAWGGRRKRWEWMTPWRCTKHRDPITHPIEKRSAPSLVLWSDEPDGLFEPAQEERKVRDKSVPIGPNPAEQARTSSLTQASETGAVIACEPKPRTIHTTDNHIKSQSSRSSWPTTLSCRMHLVVSCSQSWTCWTLLSAWWRQSAWRKRGQLHT